MESMSGIHDTAVERYSDLVARRRDKGPLTDQGTRWTSVSTSRSSLLPQLACRLPLLLEMLPSLPDRENVSSGANVAVFSDKR